ncbi:MAG TPA: pseudouridine synthase [Mucilaginibacter sp.]|jgi:23S rRNA pseudouridine2605 synthase|nr:pseudouridine synthase [Mucilaginibacter sp.]
MVFKRPGGSRNDQSGRSSNRTSNAGDRPKRSPSSKGNFAKDTDRPGSNRPSRKYGNDATGEKRPFSGERKPYQGAADKSDKPASSFRSGDSKKSFSPKARPYSGRVADSDNRREGYGRKTGADSAGDKKSFSPKRRPYTGRPADNDERPRKSFDSDNRGGEAAGAKKPFASRGKSSSSSFAGDDKPKRSFSKGPVTEDRGFKKRDTSRNFVTKERPKDTQPAGKIMRGRKKPAEPEDDGLIRLNRYISNAGICSRRKADELITAGVVSVNGEVVSELGHKVDPHKDVIRYNGETLKREKMVYVLLNKPKDYITTTEDPQERRTVMHLVEKASRERIYPIGRLDRNTTGLLLMTNDGDLADKLSHPRNSIVKLYQVELNKSLTQGDLNKIAFGLELEDGIIKPDAVSYVAGATKREVGIQIHSGKNRVVRRIFEHLGYEVVKLDRVVYANLTKKDLPRGRWRYLDEQEVIQLKHLI